MILIVGSENCSWLYETSQMTLDEEISHFQIFQRLLCNLSVAQSKSIVQYIRAGRSNKLVKLTLTMVSSPS